MSLKRALYKIQRTAGQPTNCVELEFREGVNNNSNIDRGLHDFQIALPSQQSQFIMNHAAYDYA
jgi:hypothetical protein